MATRGTKAKPIALRLVDGTSRTTRHGPEEKQRKKVELTQKKMGKLVMPVHYKQKGNYEQRCAWERYIAPCWWLDVSKAVIAEGFCELFAEFRAAPRRFAVGKHGQMRAYMAELGLTDERNRTPPPEDDEEKDEFF